jgi:tryptophan synthase alpha chain
MSRISGTFEALARNQEAAYIPYVCAGDPDKEFTIDLVAGLCSSGADLVELGLPFSDPVGDGPTIQEAMGRALSNGFEVKHLFDVIRQLRAKRLAQPIVVMSYFNPILRYGVGRFCEDMAHAGADGILVVDLPLEESRELDGHARTNGLDVIRLVAPTTSAQRMERILASASGFVYAVSASGVTGAKKAMPGSAAALLRDLRARTKVPVILGFGISAPAHVEEAVRKGASGVVEGSALVDIYVENLHDRQQAIDHAARHARTMKNATRTGADQRLSGDDASPTKQA